MADIEITTNSPKVVEELAIIKTASADAGNIISQTNLQAQQSFEQFTASVAGADENMLVFGESAMTTTPILAAAVVQTNALNTSVIALNTNIAAGNALWNEFSLSVGNSTLSMLNNTMQTGLADASIISLSGSIGNAMSGVEMLSGQLTSNTDTLMGNSDQLNQNNDGLLTTTAKLTEEQTAAQNSTQALVNNLAERQNLNAVLTDTSPIQSLTEKADLQRESFELLRMAVESLTTAEGFLAAITTVNTTLSLINNAVTLKETLAKKRNAAASSQEGIASLSAAVPKALASGAGMGLPGLIWLGAMLAMFAVGMSVYASMKSSFVPLATGGVVSAPTVALVGEGRYPEAVVPLGDSPQFASMKADIAGAVLQGLAAMNRGSGQSGNKNVEVVLNIDGDKFARAVLPAMDKEYRRKGRTTAIRSV